MSRSWTRVTVAGVGRHVELVLPADVPVGELVPELLQRFEPTSALNPTIKTFTVEGVGSLPWNSTLDRAGVADGAVLHLTDRVDAYPAPVVYDLVDETAATPAEGLHWPHGLGRTIAATAVVSLLGIIAAHLLDHRASPGTASWSVLAVSLVVAATCAVLDQRRLGLGLPLLGLSAVLGVEAAWRSVSHQGMPRWGLVGLAGVLVLAWFLGHRMVRHAAFALTTFVLLGGAWLGVVGWLGRSERAGAALAVLAMVVLGALPRLALATTGLASLDDRALRGEPLARSLAHDAIQAAHQGLAASVVACALAAAASVRLLVARPWPSTWALALAVIVVLLAALRSRVFPLVLERASLLVAAAVGLGSIIRALADPAAVGAGADHPQVLLAGGALATLCAVAVLLSLVVSVPEHVAARLRLLANRLEGLVALALVPVAVGLFGVYGALAHVR